jgi:hypothetical protein
MPQTGQPGPPTPPSRHRSPTQDSRHKTTAPAHACAHTTVAPSTTCNNTTKKEFDRRKYFPQHAPHARAHVAYCSRNGRGFCRFDSSSANSGSDAACTSRPSCNAARTRGSTAIAEASIAASRAARIGSSSSSTPRIAPSPCAGSAGNACKSVSNKSSPFPAIRECVLSSPLSPLLLHAFQAGLDNDACTRLSCPYYRVWFTGAKTSESMHAGESCPKHDVDEDPSSCPPFGSLLHDWLAGDVRAFSFLSLTSARDSVVLLLVGRTTLDNCSRCRCC